VILQPLQTTPLTDRRELGVDEFDVLDRLAVLWQSTV
jgi:hypothetical protein